MNDDGDDWPIIRGVTLYPRTLAYCLMITIAILLIEALR